MLLDDKLPSHIVWIYICFIITLILMINNTGVYEMLTITIKSRFAEMHRHHCKGFLVN